MQIALGLVMALYMLSAPDSDGVAKTALNKPHLVPPFSQANDIEDLLPGSANSETALTEAIAQSGFTPVQVAAYGKAPLFTFITGTPEPLYAKVVQSGKDQPIQLALATLLPNDYTVLVANEFRDTRVDWEASENLDETLETLRANRSGLGIVMDTNLKVVRVVSEKEAVKVYVDPKPIQWELRTEDVRLDKALRRWAKEAGYALRWDADRYVIIGADSTFTGNFESAVEQVLETPGIKNSAYPLEACVYSNEPPLIRITRMGDQTAECK